MARDVVLVAHAAREGARAAAIDPDQRPPARPPRRPAGSIRTGWRSTWATAAAPGAGCACEVRYRVPTDVPIVGRFLGDRSL